MRNQAGLDFDASKLGPRRARGMFESVARLLKEYRSQPLAHRSERDPNYLVLTMMEQALQARIQEQSSVATTAPTSTAAAPTGGAAAAMMKDPKSKAIADKVSRGQSLTPDEQQTFNKVMLAKESRKKSRMVNESELQQAQVVLAAQDMIDRVQKMMEEISEMQFKDLPALTDSIKNDMGTEQAQQFQVATSQALSTLLQSVQTSKSELESAQGVLTGQAPIVPGEDQTGMPPAADIATAAEMPVPGEPGADQEEIDLSLDANLGEPQSLGRERR